MSLTTSGVAPRSRTSGLLVPLFSATSSRSWGIGDIGDLSALCRWMAGGGQRVLQFLPLNEMAPGHSSPYSAMSAMALDPIYIRVPDVVDFAALGGEASLCEDDQQTLDAVRTTHRVDYARVRAVKARALRAAFDRFVREEWTPDTSRAAALRAYVGAEGWWLDDYVLFRALHDREGGRAWTEWPEPLRLRDQAALDEARASLASDLLFHTYLQWIAGTQWADARQAAADVGVALYGDLPFMVDLHSADVWAHQAQFALDRSVGVPPDAFSDTGQDWGMPAYDWDAMAAADYQWLRFRARRAAALFDGYRVDHLVGFYRTYSRLRSTRDDARFSPEEPSVQEALGERVLGIFAEPGAAIIAEDLGVIPDFVRASLVRLGLPGFKVFRWEREWDEPGAPFRDPALFAPTSVATTGTHDTEPLVTWWTAADEAERRAVGAIPSLAAHADDLDLATAPFNPTVRDHVLRTLIASGSDLVLLPIQDVFGWDDRVNQPATVNDTNWTYRLPWPVDDFDAHPEAVERQRALHAWAQESGRG